MDGQYYQNDPYSQNDQNKTPILAIVGFVMGILSILMGCCYGIGLIFAVAGIVMTVISNKQKKSGLGIAGLVCSIVGAVFGVIMLVYFIAVIRAMLQDPSFMEDFWEIYQQMT